MALRCARQGIVAAEPHSHRTPMQESENKLPATGLAPRHSSTWSSLPSATRTQFQQPSSSRMSKHFDRHIPLAKSPCQTHSVVP